MKQISKTELSQEISIEDLKSGSLFGALSSEAINYLVEQGQLYKVMPDEIVFDYGDRGDNFFIVCKGRIDFLKVHDGECLHTRSIGFGEELGFVAMIALHDHVGSAVAEEESIILEVSAALFSNFHEQFPFDFGIITLNLARDMARTIRKLSNSLIENSINH